MKKILIEVFCIIIGAAAAVAIIFVVLPKIGTRNNNSEPNPISENKNDGTNSKEKNEENNQTEGYEILVSKKNLTIKKGSTESFVITFTTPDESSIREYIVCKDQSNIVLVKYSDVIDEKINVEVEGLKAGTTEIEISDYNYPNRKEIVKVNVVE